MQNKTISIITPMYNCAPFVGETIRAVLSQSYRNWEMLIVDDCSPDNGAGKAIVRKYSEKDPRIKLIALEANKGSAGARNEGIRAARGDFIAFLDADDLWEPNYLERQLRFIERKNADIVFSSYKRIDEKAEKEVLPPFIVPERVNYQKILKSLPIFPSTAIVNIAKLGKHYFREELGSLRDDYVYWLYLLKFHVDYAYGNPEVLVSYRLRKDSQTANKLKVVRPHWNVLRHVEKLSPARSIYYLCCWIWISVRKYRVVGGNPYRTGSY